MAVISSLFSWPCLTVFPWRQVPTLGSQEGAFENVRMNYSGDQGQTIRQLISAHVLRRVAMCVLSSPHGRRQHLAVSHEKGKVRPLPRRSTEELHREVQPRG